MNIEIMQLMQKMKADVTEFRNCFGLECETSILSIGEGLLHDSLIVEELTELVTADNDIDRLDAIIDSCYVLTGRVIHSQREGQTVNYFINTLIDLAENLKYSFTEAWDEVHASNMSKLCTTIEEAVETRESYLFKGYGQIDIIAMENYFVVRNDADVTLPCGKFVKKGKVLKSVDYKAPDLTGMC